ncbi:MAG: hypothetical protein GWN00_28180 [Aliifodinibius sp.]|nr:hypothetical protein [Fodinibius sp.]NIV14646.1 hypothetical protein [Fodinibius sp.]NIY28540.1 hypothetical protein [Fodinibius sp.]
MNILNRQNNLFILTFVLIVCQEFVFATMIEKMSLNEIVNQSDLIIEGTVSTIESHWNEERTMIYTEVGITIQRIEKGSIKDSTITIRFIGGRVGNKAVIALGTPVFNKHEQVLLMLKEISAQSLNFFLGEQTTARLNDAYSIVGWHQGYFNIFTDATNGQKMLKQYKATKLDLVGNISEKFNLQNLPYSKLINIIDRKKIRTKTKN